MLALFTLAIILVSNSCLFRSEKSQSRYKLESDKIDQLTRVFDDRDPFGRVYFAYILHFFPPCFPCIFSSSLQHSPSNWLCTSSVITMAPRRSQDADRKLESGQASQSADTGLHPAVYIAWVLRASRVSHLRLNWHWVVYGSRWVRVLFSSTSGCLRPPSSVSFRTPFYVILWFCANSDLDFRKSRLYAVCDQANYWLF